MRRDWRAALTQICLAVAWAGLAGCTTPESDGDVVCIGAFACGQQTAPCPDGGCPPDGAVPCTGDEDCDDGDPCTAAGTCSMAGRCVAGEPVALPTDACRMCTCTSEDGVVCEPIELPDDPCQSCACDPMTGVACTPLADDEPR